jgi:iron complex outermembrane receptor protein
VIVKRNPVEQPNHHWGDGLERDALGTAFAHYPLGLNSHLYAFGSYAHRLGTGNGYRRYAGDDRNWPQIYPLGFLPEFRPIVTDYSTAGGWKGDVRGWSVDAAASFGHNGFRYDLDHTLNASLGALAHHAHRRPAPTASSARRRPGHPEPDVVLRRRAPPRRVRGLARRRPRAEAGDSPTPCTRRSARMAARALGTPAGRARVVDRRRRHEPERHGHAGGSQVFPGFSPSDASDSRRENTGVYADLETNLSRAGAGERRRALRALQRLRLGHDRASSRRATSRARTSRSAPRPATASAHRAWARSTSARW